jgi:iron complex outermembrane receptor protein
MRESKTLLNRFGTTLSQLAVGVAAAAHFSAPVSAQIEEVVVYSQKKAVSDSVQDVPSAITVVDEALMQKTFSVDLTDIGRLSPNVQLAPVSTFPNFANFTIRGIGVNNSVRTVDPAVNIYQDGMVYGFQVGTVLDVFDLESVEVLRGPQGILFGRNTTGGAVSLRTARPGGETVIKGRITAGNFNRMDFAGSVEGALSSNVSGKIAVMSRNQDGLFKDNNGGTFVPATLNPSGEQPVNPQSSQAEVDSTVIKPTIVWRINEDVDLTLLASFAKMRGGGSPTNARIPNPSAPFSRKSIRCWSAVYYLVGSLARRLRKPTGTSNLILPMSKIALQFLPTLTGVLHPN